MSHIPMDGLTGIETEIHWMVLNTWAFADPFLKCGDRNLHTSHIPMLGFHVKQPRHSKNTPTDYYHHYQVFLGE
jgi:hypothetical protein